MNWNLMFFINSVFLGIGLAMDSFSISIANALSEPDMKKSRRNKMAFIYAFFQFAMPMIGWICVHSIAEKFKAFQDYIPWIALFLLLYIGGKMILEVIIDSIKKKKESEEEKKTEDSSENLKMISLSTLMLQGIATSIDALSVGFTISDYDWIKALVSSLIIALVTYATCIFGFFIGKKVGNKLESKAALLGGIILILIGVEIFVKGKFFN